MGCEVYAFSHSASKKEDAKKMGADHFIETADPKFHQNYAQELDLIISTRNVADEFPLTEFLSYVSLLSSIRSICQTRTRFTN